MNTIKPARADIAQSSDRPRAPAITPLVIATGVFNVLVPLFFVFFTWKHAAAFIQTLRISNLLILTKAALELQFYVRKSTAPFVSTSAYAWLIALCGAVAPLLFRPTDDASDFWVATVLQVIGGAMQVYIIVAIDRSLGAAVDRPGTRRDGLHRFVRHPLYVAFMLSQYGYALNHTSFYNLCVLSLVTLFQFLRIIEEERLLRNNDEYQGYVQQTPWRVIPGVF